MQPVKRKGGRQWRKLRAALLDQEPLCRSCIATGRVTAATEVDHIIPLHKGGQEYQASNLQPLCKPCHELKTAREGTDRAFSMIPEWLDVRCNMTVVCGPPAAGKTTYVKHRANAGDIVLDTDDLIMELFGVHGHANDDMGKVAAAIQLRNKRIANAAPHDTLWLIASAPSDTERRYWKAKGAKVVLLNPGHTECIKRAKGRPRYYKAAIVRWYQAYGKVKVMNASKSAIGADGWPVIGKVDYRMTGGGQNVTE
jgi:hypothetical protein